MAKLDTSYLAMISVLPAHKRVERLHDLRESIVFKLPSILTYLSTGIITHSLKNDVHDLASDLGQYGGEDARRLLQEVYRHITSGNASTVDPQNLQALIEDTFTSIQEFLS